MELPQPSGRPAWLFDFDGTLAEIAPTPDAARVPRGLIDTVARLLDLEVAIAIVSGRPLAEIDALMAPLRLPAAGVHGAERRDAGGRVQRIAVPDLRPALDLLHSFGERHDGVRVEVKPGAVALHYRLAPQLERDCIDIMERAAAEVPAMALLRGKMVVELKPQAVDKGRAVRAFLAEPPFRGRQAWYFGDDVTDEAAFAAVQDEGGIAVKLGEGPSVAAYRLPGPEQMLRWLERAAEGFEGQRGGGR
ncbi:MAG: trehalose-phosphatase [Thiomonas sp.]|uniref:trehalose-phosphatase n=1 Tax=Thiomonas sp. TaxID=2047785 RepID=UPI002A35F308|nr:trehalose-phosphatase [Thiomonas sp.]MDY0329991.1 trehalose-phosphatase [Thiomonas sp.]